VLPPSERLFTLERFIDTCPHQPVVSPPVCLCVFVMSMGWNTMWEEGRFRSLPFAAPHLDDDDKPPSLLGWPQLLAPTCQHPKDRHLVLHETADLPPRLPALLPLSCRFLPILPPGPLCRCPCYCTCSRKRWPGPFPCPPPRAPPLLLRQPLRGKTPRPGLATGGSASCRWSITCCAHRTGGGRQCQSYRGKQTW
jgi:hypothetical protein